MDEFFKTTALPSGTIKLIFNVTIFAFSGLGMVWAIILLIFALRPAMGHQLAAARTDVDFGQQDGRADYYDEDYERRRRELPPNEPPPM
jgi:hypothetical protein